MNGDASLVAPAAAWTTVLAPSLVVLWFLCSVGAGARREQVRAEVTGFALRYRYWILGVTLLAVFVRLGWLPVFERHIYDGHEAEYFALFMHERVPTRGGTVMYPLMQWAYWVLGSAFTGELWPVLWAVGLGLGSILFMAVAVGSAFGPTVAGLVAVGVAVMGNHAFWSTSAYNVIHPAFFCCVALACAFRWRQAKAEGRPALWLWSSLWSSALLAVCLRLESGVLLVPLLAIVLGTVRRVSLREWGTVMLGAVLGVCAIWPLLFPGGLPGEGERWLSFHLNWNAFIYSGPWAHPLWLVAVIAGVGFARSATLPWIGWFLVSHLVMATFDDFGFRHMLLPSIALLVIGCVGLERIWRREDVMRWTAVFLGGSGLFVAVVDTADIATRFYQTEEAWEAAVRARYADVTLQDMTPESRPNCALISEADVIAEEPPLSHFNLIAHEEAEALRARTGCLHWCPDVQDGRWSSRAVLDRAIRVESLYELTPIGMVREPASGYACLLYEVGARRPNLRISRTTK